MSSRFPVHARVCFIGDSITHSNNYCARIAAFYKKAFPDDSILFRNAGVSGGFVGSAELFYADDVLPFHPTHATIMLGVNDSNRTALNNPDPVVRNQVLDEAFERYQAGMNRFLDRLQADGTIVTLCTPSPYVEFVETSEPPLPGGYALISRYADFVRAAAKERNLDVFDFHTGLSDLCRKETLFNPDHVHPNDMGHYRMAEIVLREQGLEPEAYQPIEDLASEAGLTEWREAVAKVRDIYAAEWMLVCNYSASFDQKMSIINEYIRNKSWGDFQYFNNLSHRYRETKPFQKELEAQVDLLAEKVFVRH